MKSVFIAGSRKFYTEIEDLIQQLRNHQIKVETAGKWDNSQEDTLESEKKALLTAFKRMDGCDLTYIYARNGYIGKTVAMEIAYAHAKKKELASSHEITDFSARALVSKVIKPEGLIEYCKSQSTG